MRFSVAQYQSGSIYVAPVALANARWSHLVSFHLIVETRQGCEHGAVITICQHPMEGKLCLSFYADLHNAFYKMLVISS